MAQKIRDGDTEEHGVSQIQPKKVLQEEPILDGKRAIQAQLNLKGLNLGVGCPLSQERSGRVAGKHVNHEEDYDGYDEEDRNHLEDAF